VSVLISSSRQAIDIFTYSKGPIHSIPPTYKLLTGLTNLDTVLAKKIPGKNLFLFDALLDDYSVEVFLSSPSSSLIEFGGRKAISNVFGTVP
jgi:hypothetical protein